MKIPVLAICFSIFGSVSPCVCGANAESSRQESLITTRESCSLNDALQSIFKKGSDSEWYISCNVDTKASTVLSSEYFALIESFANLLVRDSGKSEEMWSEIYSGDKNEQAVSITEKKVDATVPDCRMVMLRILLTDKGDCKIYIAN